MNVNLLTLGLPLAQADNAAAPAPAAPAPAAPATPAAPGNVEQTTQAPGGATPPADQKPEPPHPIVQFLPWILIAIAFYFFLLRPKNKQEKQRVAMLNALKKGDRIQTIGGILGTVVETRDDEVVVKVDETSNTKITFSRNAIHRVREEEKK